MSSCAPDYSDMTEVNISDDGRAEIDLPFTFPMYDQYFTKSWMYSNGVVGFMSAPNGLVPHFCCSGMDESQIAMQLANASLPQFAYSIAALWTDLVDTNADHDGDGIPDTGFYYESYDTNNDGQADTMRYFWRGISEFYNPETSNTFEVKIDEVGLIEITHFEIDIRNHQFTVGVFGGNENEYQVFEYDSNKNIDPADGTETFTFNFDLAAACAANPLFSPSCTGYAEAYAQLIYNQSCSADPLYDIGCPGYEQAYFDQQCSINPLYDSGCSGYEQAYFDQQCSLDPFYDTTCPGYAEAYYDQQCKADPLYDSGCTGYETAFYELQCSLNPLYDSGCTGYAEAYYNQQCSINALYDSGCPGYETAYYNQQCSLDPLYDSGCNGYADAYFSYQCGLDSLYDAQCPGYAEAYYLQQCGIDALYDAGCTGYEEAYFAKYIQPELDKQAEEAAGVSEEEDTTSTQTATTTSTGFVDPVTQATQPSTTGDASVDRVLRKSTNVSPIVSNSVEVATIPATTTVEETKREENPEEVETTSETDTPIEVAQLEGNDREDRESESSSDVDEPVEESGNSDSDDSKQGEERSGSNDSSGGSESRKSDRKEPSKEQKENSKREKIKQILIAKAKDLANDQASAASLEQQQMLQQQVLAVMSYVYGFDAYKIAVQGGTYPDADFYANQPVPNEGRGLLNGLAQQILHEKMVDMQYENN